MDNNNELHTLKWQLDKTMMEQYNLRRGLFDRYDKLKIEVEITSDYANKLNKQIQELKKEIESLKRERESERFMEKTSRAIA